MTASHAPRPSDAISLRRALRTTSLSVYARDCLTVNLYDCLLRVIQSVFVSGLTDTETQSWQVKTRAGFV